MARVYRRKDREQWYADLRHHGARRRVPLKARLKRDAQVEAARLARDFEREQRTGDEQTAGTPTLEAFAGEWMDNYVHPTNKHSEAVSKGSILDNHLVPWFGSTPLEDITLREIDAYKAAKLDADLSPKTVNNQLAVLRRMLNTAAEWGVIVAAPKIKALRAPQQEVDYLTAEEADRLLEAARSEPAWRTAILLALRTGLRQGEITELRWQDVDLDAGTITVKRSRWKGVVDSPKSGRSRTVYLGPEVVDALNSHRAQDAIQDELVFCQHDGSPYTQSMMRWPMRRLCRRAGLRVVQWHALRHSFASHLAMAGAPLLVIQLALGHRSLNMVLRYAHLAPSDVRPWVLGLDKKQSGTVKRAPKRGTKATPTVGNDR